MKIILATVIRLTWSFLKLHSRCCIVLKDDQRVELYKNLHGKPQLYENDCETVALGC